MFLWETPELLPVTEAVFCDVGLRGSGTQTQETRVAASGRPKQMEGINHEVSTKALRGK